jgi:hypothetical protein
VKSRTVLLAVIPVWGLTGDESNNHSASASTANAVIAVVDD